MRWVIFITNKGGTADYICPYVDKGRFFISQEHSSCEIKKLRRMRARAKQKYVAKATALGARVPQAELFIIFTDTAFLPGVFHGEKRHDFPFPACEAGDGRK